MKATIVIMIVLAVAFALPIGNQVQKIRISADAKTASAK